MKFVSLYIPTLHILVVMVMVMSVYSRIVLLNKNIHFRLLINVDIDLLLVVYKQTGHNYDH